MILSRGMKLHVVLIAVYVVISSGFLPLTPITFTSHASCSNRQSPHLLWAKNDDFVPESVSRNNMARTCVRTFLTQRAIQSFMFLLESCRDPHTVKWFEDTFGFQSLDQFHGTGAFNSSKYETWDSVLLDIMSRPKQVIVISARRRGRGHGGWSKNNPFLPDRFVEFEIDIDPPSLVSRIISVRDQLAAEFVEDLDTMKIVNEKILESYFSNLVKARERDVKEKNKDDSNVPVSDDKPPTFSKRTAYTRDSMFMLSNSVAFNDRSSPYRAGNFDLMLLLNTQESVHRVLRDYRESGLEREVSFEWLRNFYIARVANFFDGQQTYGRADDFLEELLLTPPSLRNEANVVTMIDPLRIAEDIIRKRSLVADEWKDIMANVGRDHVELRKALLSHQMRNKMDNVPSQSNIKSLDKSQFE